MAYSRVFWSCVEIFVLVKFIWSSFINTYVTSSRFSLYVTQLRDYPKKNWILQYTSSFIVSGYDLNRITRVWLHRKPCRSFTYCRYHEQVSRDRMKRGCVTRRQFWRLEPWRGSTNQKWSTETDWGACWNKSAFCFTALKRPLGI